MKFLVRIFGMLQIGPKHPKKMGLNIKQDTQRSRYELYTSNNLEMWKSCWIQACSLFPYTNMNFFLLKVSPKEDINLKIKPPSSFPWKRG